MGSEMCIRDRFKPVTQALPVGEDEGIGELVGSSLGSIGFGMENRAGTSSRPIPTKQGSRTHTPTFETELRQVRLPFGGSNTASHPVERGPPEIFTKEHE